MGVVLRQASSKNQWTVLMGYLTNSTNVRRYQTHHRWHFFSFTKIAHRCIVTVCVCVCVCVCVTQSNWVKYVIFVFRVLPGSAEAQVIWGGIVKRLFIAYFIGNIYAKKYQNPFMCVNVIASQRWDVFFETRCIRTRPLLSYLFSGGTAGACVNPTTAVLAHNYLTKPAASEPCELFSLSVNTITKKRVSLSSGNVDKLVYLSGWETRLVLGYYFGC